MTEPRAYLIGLILAAVILFALLLGAFGAGILVGHGKVELTIQVMKADNWQVHAQKVDWAIEMKKEDRGKEFQP